MLPGQKAKCRQACQAIAGPQARPSRSDRCGVEATPEPSRELVATRGTRDALSSGICTRGVLPRELHEDIAQTFDHGVDLLVGHHQRRQEPEDRVANVV